MTEADRRTLSLVMAVVAAVFFLYFVWPGRYVYRSWGDSIVRINNVSGDVDYLDYDKWVPIVE